MTEVVTGMGGFSRGGTDSRPAEDSRYGLDRVRVLDSRAKPAGEGLSPRTVIHAVRTLKSNGGAEGDRTPDLMTASPSPADGEFASQA